MEQIHLWHIAKSQDNSASSIPFGLSEEELAKLRHQNGVFTLETCQRYILVSRNKALPLPKEAKLNSDLKTGPDAYQFLLETICGLKSRLIGETEIVGQFKEGFEKYLESNQRDSKLIKIFHKLFMDAKKIRSEHLKNIGLLSYCGLTKKLIKDHIRENKFHHIEEVNILGSGKLAHDLLKVLNKNYQVNVYARNEEALSEIQKKYSAKIINSVDQKDLINKSIIINTIGTDRVLFRQDFFENWKSGNSNRLSAQSCVLDDSLFVDLSSPSVIETSYGKLNAVYRLDDLFKMAKMMHQKKEVQVNHAQNAIHDLTNHRHAIFSPSSITGQEGSRFART